MHKQITNKREINGYFDDKGANYVSRLYSIILPQCIPEFEWLKEILRGGSFYIAK